MDSGRRPDGLIGKTLAAIRREGLLCPGDTVLVALSGGADSMALLDALLRLRGALGLAGVEAAHVHHGLRGQEADRDERFVRDACRRLAVPLRVFHVDVRQAAAEAGRGLEETGRRLRYACLARAAGETGAVVAAAHTRSDNVETVLLHLARGCGLRGLCGIPAQRLLPCEEAEAPDGGAGDGKAPCAGGGVRLVRPLIDCTRREVEDYCTRRGIAYVTDSTNREEAYARNRIRRRVVPELERVNPGLETAVARLVKRAGQDAAYLEGQAAEALQSARREDGFGGYDRERLRALPAPLRSRALGMIAAGAGSDYTEAQVEAMERLLETGGTACLAGGVRVRVSQGRVRVLPGGTERGKAPAGPAGADGAGSGWENPPETRIQPGLPFAFCGRMTMPRLLPLEEYEKHLKIHKNLLKNALNYDKISGYLAVRSRRPGDSYHPTGRGVGKTLKKLLGEAGIPAEQRDRVPVYCDRRGIVLVGGFGCDERVRVGPDTRQVLVFEPAGSQVRGGGQQAPPAGKE
ncbi:MAG TPA: tRNA lysidine(34) synthetase TilS [Firmicutes bacterium]|nr:tRNA lysidine(34) synthetase TilS [Bacillota bacterium]